MRWPYRSLLTLCSLVFSLQAHAFDTATFTSSVTDPVRARDIAYTLYYPENFSGVSPLVLVSHGGIGSTSGHLEYPHLGTEYAEMGYIAIHVNHLASANILIHRLDRPAVHLSSLPPFRRTLVARASMDETSLRLAGTTRVVDSFARFPN